MKRWSKLLLRLPEVLEVTERELLAEVRHVVLDVDAEALVLAAILRTAQPSTDHLLIQVGAVRRPGDEDRPDCRRVEPLGQDRIVCEDSDSPLAELLNVVAAWTGLGETGYRLRRDAVPGQ